MKLDSKLKKFLAILYKIAEEQKCSRDVLESLEIMNSLWKKDPQFRSLILSKRISKEEKDRILTVTMGGSCHPLVIEFVIILMDHRAMDKFSILKTSYESEFNVKHRIIKVDAAVSRELDVQDRLKLQNGLESNLKMNTDLQVRVDPTLLGGIKLRIGNTFLDATIQRKMERLKENLLQS
ncbi:MAG: ATP synthase F1 subunit delta [Candidatus Marinimicrobia bacterium]|jgi:F-type H+-transporting ATPase subunit delta|nr:ATP synthase F1 subunit delta [Candidatus Neomarinimicrobiota bacterium]